MSLVIRSYSDKAFILYGEDTKKFKDEIKTFGAKWNSSLSGSQGKAWVLSNKKLEDIKKWINEKTGIEATLLEKEEKVAKPELVKEELRIVTYSEKAVALFGYSKDYVEELKVIGGRYNPYLKDNGNVMKGWIFSNKKKVELENWLKSKSK
jgi:hypothetical protein